MAVRARSGLGRPPAIGVEEKQNLTCYVSVAVVEGLTHLAERELATRNKLMARVLTEYVARELPAPALLTTLADANEPGTAAPVARQPDAASDREDAS
ncbi:MAG: hypothetical protein M3Q65_09740 [Chloroflexota bacterium]|nr:hypothetical protein [Chloroflexota bacterium]